MITLLLALSFTIFTPTPRPDLDDCHALAPVQAPSPITWGGSSPDPDAMWTEEPPVPQDTVQSALRRIRRARRCFLNLDPSKVSRPYLGNIMRTYDREAALLAARRQFTKSFEIFDKARSFFAKDPAIPSSKAGRTSWPSILHQNQGYLHYLLGDLSSSIAHYLKAYEVTPKEDAVRRIDYLIDLGTLHQRTQDYRSARHYFNRADHRLQASRSSLPDRDQLRARVYHAQADLLLEKTLNTAFERDTLKRAADFARRGRFLAEPGSKRYARVSLGLSESLGYLGAFEQAYRLNKEVRQYARTNDRPGLHAFALLKLGVLHMQTERWSQADPTLHEALTQAENLGNLDHQRRILRALGRLHEMQGELAKAGQYYRKGVAVIEKYRASLTASQWSMTAFAQWRDVHRGLVRALLAQNRPRSALTALDRSRARHLQDLRAQARVSTQLPPAKRTRLDSLSRALTDVRNRLGEAPLPLDREAALRNQEVRLMAARQQLLQLDSASSRPSLDTISETLTAEDRVLVSYFLDDPWPVYDRSPRSAAFVLTADTLQTVPLPDLTQDSVRAQVKAISPLFNSRQEPHRINAMHFDLRPLRQLHDQLYAPIAEHLSSDQPLTVIPDGPMFHVPYSMLATATPGGRYGHAQARFVLHERPTTLELATSMVGDTSESSFDPATVTPDLAALGASEFDTLRTIPSALRASLPKAASDSTLPLPPLPGVRSEMNMLNKLFGDVETYLNEAATESAFNSASQRAGVLHLASHAFVHPSSPLQNAFLLHPDSTSDGILFLHELQSRDRSLPLAVLSGCSTARGTLHGGEGMAGLQYAFRTMGAQSTVSNLWPTADQPSVALIKNFYRNLRADLPKDRALRQAKLTYLNSHPDQASPFFWASTVLYGSPQPVPLEGAAWSLSWSGWLLFGIALLALLMGLLLWRFTRFSMPYRRVFST